MNSPHIAHDVAPTRPRFDGPGDQPLLDFSRTYSELSPFLIRVSVSKFHLSIEDAEALVQDVFLSYYRAAHRISGDPRPYLLVAICQASRRFLHKRRSEESLSERDDLVETNSREIDALVLRMTLHTVLTRVEPRRREVLRRFYLDGQKPEDIAVALSTSTENVYTLLSLARKDARRIYASLSLTGSK